MLGAVAALAVRTVYPGPPAATLKGVASMLGEATVTQVDPGEFIWEPSRGIAADALLGRRVLFLGRASPGAARDLFRAAVRVTLEGQPIAVSHVVNLTDSPFGDEQGLVGRGEHVAYATVSFGAVQQVTLLDLRGDAAEMPSDPLVRVMGWLTNAQTTGAFEGLARTEVSANIRAKTASVSLDDQMLSLAIDGGSSRVGVVLATGQVSGGDTGVSAIQVPHLAKPPILWAVDTVRAVTGPEPIAWLEENVFDARDTVKRMGHQMMGQGGADEQLADRLDGADGPQLPPSPPAPPQTVGADGVAHQESWPPQHLRSIFKQSVDGEGDWKPPRHKFLPENRSPGASEPAPSYFYQTFVRPDPKRPWAKVWMVAMDSRQLRLGMQGGIEDPKPLTGARGEGRIPQDPAILYRTVGAFNGAFKTTHGEYGMMVDRRVLLPPKPGGATILVSEDGRAGFGTWPASPDIPADVVSFRQNLDPLVDDGRLNPAQRQQWGWHSHATGMLTHRSGLCLTSTGHLVYAWGPEVTGDTLGNAMVQAGCTYAVHLDMNPHHTAFAYINVRGPGARNRDAELLHPGMEVLPERFIVWSPKDFFYLTLRSFGPEPIEGVDLSADDGAQPPPAWAPAVFKSAVSTRDGTKVDVFAFSPQRTSFRLRAGTGTQPTSSHAVLEPALTGRVLAAIVTGGESAEPQMALRVGGEQLGATGGGASLAVDAKGKVRIERAAPKGEPSDFAELPLLGADGEASAQARQKGPNRRRTAICTSPDGFVWMAVTKATSDVPLVDALEKARCEVIAGLDRGAGKPARLFRAGTEAPPLDRYDRPTLYVLGSDLASGAFPWKPGG